ncbi:L-seryl-tRNA(Sec) selenium transferase [Stackebrandtia albiflava]|uniref:L-seryl-tRNA(Sec) selenium transferase n=1 Tax=Stackebrandtia albiflava TaxID=406432 RepID=A0A562UR77_9ACTN|nr:L-seryl-tRNA(Sec) selenium transferase [Stackebrandtia albiflava]TWJ08111.1 L-seryl-tRNA(Sec) selenium transferase [Stackebrandtia albiflava]
MDDIRRRVPRTDAVLADDRLRAAAATLGRRLVREVVADTLARVRAGEIPPESAADAATAALPDTAAGLREVLNATGVVVHTNLGRAPLSRAARDAVVAAAGYTDVEFDLRDGRRAPRGRTAVAALAAAVPEAEACHVVNNNAAALALVATVLAAGREIVISRGELVEIGDGFRIPDLLTATGARLREVGTTNRTSLDDYADAIGSGTGFVLKVHPANFTQTGFVSAVPVGRLTGLGVPVVSDVGSGLLRPDPALPGEPDVATELRAGAHLVTASGDKLLGGPQAGLMLGTRDLVDRLRRHPLARALRVDKLTLAALEATLSGPPTPVAAALAADPERLRDRAEAVAAALTGHGVEAVAVASTARVGGGGAPEVSLPSAAVSLPAGLAGPLRNGRPAVVGRLHRDRLLLDLRAVPADADDRLVAAVLAAG